MNKMNKALAVAALMAASASANAVTIGITFGGTNLGAPDNNATTSVAGATVINFNAASNTAGCGTIASYGISGNANIVAGSVGGLYAAPPLANTTCYLTVPQNSTSGSAVWNSPGSNNYLGLFWGSIDNYNSLQFLDGSNNVLATVTGAQVIAAATAFGDQTAPGSNRYVNLLLTGGTYEAVRFISNGYAFEIDNIAYANVPEPATLGLLGLGLAGIGFARRRK